MFFITKKIALFWGVILVCISTVLSSSSHALERKVADLVTAYGYVIGQNHSLDLIQKKFPNLKGYTDYCKNYFLVSPLGKGWKGVEAELQKMDSSGNFKSSMLSRINKEFEKFDRQFSSSNITQHEAKSFCDEVLERTKGNIPEPILLKFLEYNTDYLAYPSKELLDGWHSEYNTKGHPKAGPIDISISFPKTWKIKKGNRPHILSNWSRNYENFLAGANIQVTAAPQLAAFPDHEVYSYLRSDNSFTDWVPEGGRLISGEHYTIENIPFVCVTFDGEITRLDFSIVMRSTIFLSYYNGHIFQFNFNISSKDNDLDKIQKIMFPLYKSIMNTLVINNQYTN